MTCCITLADCVEDERVPIFYAERFNRYQIPLRHSSSIQVLTFCPFCSDELPDLTDLYYDSLEEKFGKDVDFSTVSIPEDFLTGAWWQKAEV